MDGMTWNTEEVKKLRRLRLDPIRNTPDRLRSLVEHFLKPGASVFAVTEGDGPVRVSKTLARKVRDLPTLWNHPGVTPAQQRGLAREVFQEVRLREGRLVAVRPRPRYAPLFAYALWRQHVAGGARSS